MPFTLGWMGSCFLPLRAAETPLELSRVLFVGREIFCPDTEAQAGSELFGCMETKQGDEGIGEEKVRGI